ncbi:hypothetical protein PAPYR_4814 [Paratrimastix pyriformis]|uniref:C-type lectin domain-containing protein n=1 Tax=Paratrimastix pyriformis TaxID=342808 RepID=A0ABQ8ULF7_9EUKA|nr:hypothetical protein PAPYR_4814 [Paratrimastix pyriformis]
MVFWLLLVLVIYGRIATSHFETGPLDTPIHYLSPPLVDSVGCDVLAVVSELCAKNINGSATKDLSAHSFFDDGPWVMYRLMSRPSLVDGVPSMITCPVVRISSIDANKVIFPAPATNAADSITIPVPQFRVPSAHFTASFQTLSLGPATLSGYPVDLVHISVTATGGGQVRLGTVPAGLSTADKCVNTYWSTGAPSFCFVGSQADVNTALASLQFWAASGTGASQYSVVIQATPGGAIYFAQNQHYYQLETAATWSQQLCRSEWVYSGGLAAINVATCLPTSGTRTRRTFNGLNGYMATVTSPEENQLVYQVHGSWCWLPATDQPHEGVWTWETGPEKGTVLWNSSCRSQDRERICSATGFWNNWMSGQPDNNGGREHFLHQWASPGWNDYIGTYALATVVEYGGMGGSPLHEAVTGTIDITLDDSPPVFMAVTIASDHPDGNTSRAWIGDVVTVRCLCDEELAAAPVVLIGGRPATVTAGSEPRLWLAQITVALTDGEWPMGFEIASATDLAGNSMPSAVVGATTGPSAIDYDYEVIPVSIDTSHAPTAALLVTSRRFIPTPAHLTAPASGRLATLHAAVRAVGGLVRLGSAPPAGVVGPLAGGFSTDWTVAAATLDLEGTPADLDAALASLQFAPLAGQATAQLTVFLVPPEMAFLSTTAHFYNVTDTKANWPQSRCGALWEYPVDGGTVDTADCTSSTGRRRHRAWNGLWGYLATATSERENTLLAELVPGHRTAFLGGTDIEREGDWKWVDGPEAGQVFWRWGSCPTGLCGTCTATGRYSCWNTGEPNNSGIESALSINPARGVGTYLFALWNDLPPGNQFHPSLVEYGGALCPSCVEQRPMHWGQADATFAVDDTPPTVAWAQLASSNPRDTTRATRGHTVTLSITANESLPGPPRAVLLCGGDGDTLALTMTGGPVHFVGSAVVVPESGGGSGGGGCWVEGPLGFRVEEMADWMNYTMASPVTCADPGPCLVTLDFTPPHLTAVAFGSTNPNPGLAKAGDRLTLTLATDEPLYGAPRVTIGEAAHLLVASGALTQWTASVVLGAGDPEGLVGFRIEEGATDAAGNPMNGTALPAATQRTTIRYDRTPPAVLAVSVASNNTVGLGWAALGDAVWVNITASEELLTGPTVRIGTHLATVEWLGGGGGGGTAGQRFGAWAVLDGTDSEGVPVVVSVGGCVDLAGNAQTADATNTTDGSWVILGFLFFFGKCVDRSLRSCSPIRIPPFISAAPGLPPDGARPTLPVVRLASSTNPNPAWATRGDNATLSFVASEPLVGLPRVTIGQHHPALVLRAALPGGANGSAGSEEGGWAHFTATARLDATDDEGPVPFVVEGCVDRAGNEMSPPVRATSDASGITFDLTSPTIVRASIASSNGDPALARSGDTVLLEFEASEPLLGLPMVTLAGHVILAPADLTGGPLLFQVALALGDADLEGLVQVVIAGATDRAGNVQPLPLTNTTDGSAVTVDMTPPRLVGVTMRSSNEHDPALARAGDQVTLVLTASEPLLGPPTVTIAGRPAAWVGCLDAGPAANRTWAARLTLNATDPEGPVAFAVEAATDRATNPLAPVPVNLTSDATGVWFDRTPPTLVAVIFASTNDHAPGRLARPGDSLVLNLTASEPLRVPPAVLLAGRPANLTGGPTAWQARLVLGPADPEGWLGFEVRSGGSGSGSGARDMAGNGLVLPDEPLVNATAGPSGVTYDRTPPQLRLGSLTTSNRNPTRARPGDALTALLLASEPLYSETFLDLNAVTCVLGTPTCAAYAISCTANITTCTAFAPCTNSSSSSSAATTGSNTTCPTNGTASTPVCTAYSTSCAAYSTRCSAYLPSCTANVTIGGRLAALRALNATAWEARLVMGPEDEEGLVAGVTVGGALRDEAGNPCGELLPGDTAVVFGHPFRSDPTRADHRPHILLIMYHDSDRTPPVPTDVTLSSSNAIPRVALPGDVLTLRFAVSEPLRGGELVVTVAGHPVVAVPVQEEEPDPDDSSSSSANAASALPSAIRFEAAYRPTLAADRPGPLGFAISTLEDLAGNTLEGPVSNATLGPSLVYFGSNCTLDADCTRVTDNATCVATVSGVLFGCACPPGLSGPRCETGCADDAECQAGGDPGARCLPFEEGRVTGHAPPDPPIFHLNPLGPGAAATPHKLSPLLLLPTTDSASSGCPTSPPPPYMMASQQLLSPSSSTKSKSGSPWLALPVGASLPDGPRTNDDDANDDRMSAVSDPGITRPPLSPISPPSLSPDSPASQPPDATPAVNSPHPPHGLPRRLRPPLSRASSFIDPHQIRTGLAQPGAAAAVFFGLPARDTRLPRQPQLQLQQHHVGFDCERDHEAHEEEEQDLSMAIPPPPPGGPEGSPAAAPSETPLGPAPLQLAASPAPPPRLVLALPLHTDPAGEDGNPTHPAETDPPSSDLLQLCLSHRNRHPAAAAGHRHRHRLASLGLEPTTSLSTTSINSPAAASPGVAALEMALEEPAADLGTARDDERQRGHSLSISALLGSEAAATEAVPAADWGTARDDGLATAQRGSLPLSVLLGSAEQPEAAATEEPAADLGTTARDDASRDLATPQRGPPLPLSLALLGPAEPAHAGRAPARAPPRSPTNHPQLQLLALAGGVPPSDGRGVIVGGLLSLSLPPIFLLCCPPHASSEFRYRARAAYDRAYPTCYACPTWTWSTSTGPLVEDPAWLLTGRGSDDVSGEPR